MPERITVSADADWTGCDEALVESLKDVFADRMTDWFWVRFPFMWSTGLEASDGLGGKPVTNPLELRIELMDVNDAPAVTRHYDIAAMLLDDMNCHMGSAGYDEAGAEWAERTALALEALAAKIRGPLRK